jgi:hypothetical protein
MALSLHSLRSYNRLRSVLASQRIAHYHDYVRFSTPSKLHKHVSEEVGEAHVYQPELLVYS